jgi:hypothetical protein
MAGATGGAGTAYLSVAHEFTLGCFVGFELLALKFYVNNFIDHCLSSCGHCNWFIAVISFTKGKMVVVLFVNVCTFKYRDRKKG